MILLTFPGDFKDLSEANQTSVLSPLQRSGSVDGVSFLGVGSFFIYIGVQVLSEKVKCILQFVFRCMQVIPSHSAYMLQYFDISAFEPFNPTYLMYFGNNFLFSFFFKKTFPVFLSNQRFTVQQNARCQWVMLGGFAIRFQA